MIRPILDTLAKHLVDTHKSGTGGTQVILPNRRAGLFLQQHLARYTREPGWAPQIYSIGDYIDEFSLLTLADPIDQLLVLYDIYREVKANPEPLDEFYYWGEIMVKDFDEIDKYLIDPDLLFTNITDLKEIEEPLAGLDDWQISFVRQFWEGFHHGQPTSEKKEFIEMWKLLPVLYNRLRSKLENRREGYQGMQYREIAGRIERSEAAPPTGVRTLIAGFNALNGCEKRIFAWLQHHGAEFFWDHDHHYSGDPASEAGRFMKENLGLFPAKVELEPFTGMDDDKDIRIFELPSDVLQAKTVHRILEEKKMPSNPDCTDTAIVLCDEELLMPVLMSLPGSLEEINVTMGYPMRNTPVSGFVDLLFRLQHNARISTQGEERFYHKDVRSILLHPYMDQNGKGKGNVMLEEMASRNLIQVEKTLFQSSFEKKIFRCVEGTEDLIRYLREVFLHILENLAAEEGRILPELHREFIFRLLIQLNKLDAMVVSRPEISRQVVERLLRKVLSGLSVPFEGEPLSGLQVMGILETRLLDFKHVILLSMNEEVMPASHFRQSYIPYGFREAFGMPSREDMDAIYAYYFNRLLQRAEKVDLLYNSTTEGVRTGEMSRYLHQLIYRRGIRVNRPEMEIMARETPPLEVPHTPAIDQKLLEFSVSPKGKRYLSPSAINAYLDCPLKFYLRYIAGIGEPDEVLEEIDAAGFGTVVHDTIRLLYEEIAEGGGIISRERLEQLGPDKIESVLTSVFRDHHFRGSRKAVIEGRNIIILRVMARYLKKIIETDRRIAPFHLVSVEKSYQRELLIPIGDKETRIRLGGKIDRVDRIGDILRVIDYKTGDAKQGFPDIEALFDSKLSSRNGAALQTLLYAWLVSAEHPGERVMPGLYVMKALYSEDFDPALTMGSYRQRSRIDSFADLEEKYLELLKETLSHIFNRDIPFVQTEVEANCRYCDFAAICNRGSIE